MSVGLSDLQYSAVDKVKVERSGGPTGNLDRFKRYRRLKNANKEQVKYF